MSTKQPDDSSNEALDIAIIGMAGRFPGAANLEAFWANLVEGIESIRSLSDEELLRAGVARREFEQPGYVKVCPVLDDIDKFDAAFFGLSPRDASVMDPAHRFFLEVAWAALEHSGNTGLPQDGRVGVFASSGWSQYLMDNVRTHPEIMESMGEFLVRHTSNDMNFLATRVSYDFDLRGPSLNIQTACSSTLVAAHLARKSLLAGECDMALVGGSAIALPMSHGYHFKEGEILSPDGHCRPFDHRSAGTVFGSGTACLVLKRLGDALDNGDTVHAVIKGSAVNNDGAMKVSFLAPGVEGQVGVIRDALKAARVDARSVSYVEAHGTGTSVGDPIELTALDQAFVEQTQDKQFCGIGSVKSNIGHLGEAAAGASLIKVVMALKHRQIPASLGYEKPNPRFPLDDSPFFVNAALREWNTKGPLRAGITALGAGGTNCHLILEEAPPALPGEGARPRQLLVLSAKSKTALDRMSQNLANHLEQNPTADLADVAYTLCLGRRPMPHRRVLSATDAADAARVLRGESPTRIASTAADLDAPPVVYSFPGGGAQYARMCFDLYEGEPVYRAALDECFAIIDRELDPNLRPLLFAAQGNAEVATKTLAQPSMALPTLFAVEYALVRLFASYGITPSAFVGHSMGEYVAACLAGVFSLRDGLRLVHLRGRLFEKTVRGKMIGVSLSETDTLSLMPKGLSIAAVNAPLLCVASGPSDLVETFSKTLTEKEIDWTPIHIDVAAHSSLLDPILPEFRAFCRTIHFHPPTKPIVSNLTGRWLSAAEATDPEYWVKHLRGTVRFADCVETILEGGPRVFLEIGPGRTLTTLVSAQRTRVKHAVNSVRHPKEPAHDMEYALLTLGKVWAAGATVDWTALYDGQLRNRIPLPTYPFDGQSYWLAPKTVREPASGQPIKRENMDEWFQTVVWEPAPLVTTAPVQATHWLLFARDPQLAFALKTELARAMKGALDITIVSPGGGLRRLEDTHFELSPGNISQYRELLEELKSEGRTPEQVVLLQVHDAAAQTRSDPPDVVERLLRVSEYVAGVKLSQPSQLIPTDLERVQRAFFKPVHLAQAMGAVLDRVAFTIVTERAFCLKGETVDPFARLALGPAQVIPRELPDIATRLLDLGAVPTTPKARKQRVDQLVHELLSGSAASPVALRTPGRYTRRLRPLELPTAETGANLWNHGDVVLITGGLGGIGLTLALHLARKKRLRLALLSREGLPPHEGWSALLGSASTSSSLKRRISAVLRLEALGAQVLPVRGDVSKTESLQQALNEIHSHLGSIDVVIHAAGLMDDEPLQTKSDDAMERVLAPKVIGTLNLDRLIDYDLRAFVVMSSIASTLGLPGQVDYTAANAFLDAFAEERQGRAAGRTLAIDWNAWRDVGMIVDVDQPRHQAALTTEHTTHPWLETVQVTPTGRRYLTDFSVAKHWLLAEHQIEGGDPLIPGTGLVELARAAGADTLGTGKERAEGADTIELRQVTFLSPFQAPKGHSRRMQLDVDWSDDAVRVTARTEGNAEIHMTAEVLRCGEKPETRNIALLRARSPRAQTTRAGFLQQDFVRFGTRWQNIEELNLGHQEAWLTLALKEEFKADLGALPYHPALLDMATGAAQTLIPGFQQATDFWVPFGYDRIRVFAAVTRRVHSHVRLRPETNANIAAFDVDVLDETGQQLISIEGFTMKRVTASAGITQKSHEQADSSPRRNAVMEALLREAITPEEGVVAFDRAMAQENLSQIVASSVDVTVWLAKLQADAQRLKSGQDTEASSGFARPALESEFVPPVGPLEAQLALIWSKLLGVANVGVLDDFFELGGNSLVAVRFFARVKRDFAIALPLSTLFQAPTIRALAQALKEQGYTEPPDASETRSPSAAATVPAKPRASNTVAAPLLIRPGTNEAPLFFIHDGLGEVMLYRSLAMHLAPGRAVYGLPPETVRGQILHTHIADMARAKIERIKSIQPKGPYLLAGLCAGGVIAFELARQLQDLGDQTCFVGVIDAADVDAAPVTLLGAKSRLERVRATLLPSQKVSLLRHLAAALPQVANKASNFVRYEVSTRAERVRNARKVSEMRATGNTSNHAVPEISFLKIYEQAHKDHEAKGKFSGGRVVLFRATQGDGTQADIPFRDLYAAPDMGWSTRVAGTIQVVDVPGGHSSALQEPHVASLAKQLQMNIDLALLEHNAHE